ncbi:MAG: SDR family NAD(P)-dependent oxidoreductase [Anaerolineaceae bacterium]|nr:SDR family NAD(P)-dependent oxidoreductase [Anaerolineaceae bacterium]
MQVPEELQFMVNARMPQKTTDVRLDGKRVIITGATSGVGYEAAKRFAAGGAAVVMVVRNPEKAAKVREELTQTYDVPVDVVLADFTRLEEVRAAAQQILDRFPRIDVLINNAGVHRTKLTFTEAGFETVFGVNHLASFLFTRLLLDRVIESAPARIIQVNSEGHRFGTVHLDDLAWEHHRYTGLKSYGAARTAQLLTVWELAERLAGTGVTINAMHPGAVRSNLGMDRQNNFIYKVYKRYFLSLFLKPPEISGEALYYLAAAPEMAEVTGKFFNLTIEEKPAAHALDRELGKKVWQVSETLTGLA